MTLSNLMPVRRGDRTYWYLRQKGQPLVRLPDLPHDDPDFLAAYAAAQVRRRDLRHSLHPKTIG